jgi:hypothetical protein
VVRPASVLSYKTTLCNVANILVLLCFWTIADAMPILEAAARRIELLEGYSVPSGVRETYLR